MKAACVLGATLDGGGARIVTVEARFEASDRRSIEVVLSGLPDPVIRESRGRLLAALGANGLGLPNGRLTLNLAPAGRRKSGEGLDLPIALAAAIAGGHLAPDAAVGTLFLGELGIDGRLHDVPGGLAAATAARERGIQRLVAPPGTAREAALLPGLAVLAAPNLARAVRYCATEEGLERVLPADEGVPTPPEVPLDAVRGQEQGKRALAAAAVGGHALLFVGPPGTGKSLLARALPGLLPPLSLAERLEVGALRSAAGLETDALPRARPFRAPHSSVSHAGLIGGGSPPAPGEVTLAHRGVLFLDELPEFRRDALEALRSPLEADRVLIARAGRRLDLPAHFCLVAAMNPCPCGYRGHPRVVCRCSPNEVRRYRQRISGPLLDRVELRAELPAPPVADVVTPPRARVRGDALLATIARARARMLAREGDVPNARLDADALDRSVPLSGPARRLLERAVEQRGLSTRAVQGLRRVARTLADLADEERVDGAHLAEALALRTPLE